MSNEADQTSAAEAAVRVRGRGARLRDQSDEALVWLWRRGDLAAASVAIQRYERLVYGSALRVLRDPHRAEDATQDAFLKAHQQIERLREPAALPGWLKRIAISVAIDELRRTRPDDPLDDFDAPDTGLTPAEAAEVTDALERFAAALERLPASLRIVVSLRDVEGLSTSEAAELLGVSEAAVKMRLSRGRRAVRDLVGGGDADDA